MFRGGGPPLGHLRPPQSWKNHVAAEIERVTANILHILVDILHVVADKAVEEAKCCWPKKIVFTFWKFFWGGFSKVKIHFFSKSAQKVV